MKRFCLGICMVLLFSAFAASQASQPESQVRNASDSYHGATLLRLIARAHTQTRELQHTSVLDSPIIAETIVTYEFSIRSGEQRYVSRYTPEKQPGNLPDAWWRGNAPVQIRVSNRKLLIRLPDGGELSSRIMKQGSTDK